MTAFLPLPFGKGIEGKGLADSNKKTALANVRYKARAVGIDT